LQEEQEGTVETLAAPELIEWRVVEFSSERMKVKLDMSEKLYVSTGESRDQVHFRFLNNSIFVTENNVHMSNFPDLSIEV
jgi:hypothetical protein